MDMRLPISVRSLAGLRPPVGIVVIAALSFTILAVGVLRTLPEKPSYKVATIYSPIGGARANTGVQGVLGGQTNADGTACLWLQSDGSDRNALLWPNGYSAHGKPLTISDQNGRAIGVVGQFVILDGSTMAPEDIETKGRTVGILGCPPMSHVVIVAR